MNHSFNKLFARVLSALLCVTLVCSLAIPAVAENAASTGTDESSAVASSEAGTPEAEQAASDAEASDNQEEAEEAETGKAKTETGLAASLMDQTPAGPLEISEVTVSNSTSAPLWDGTCCDWVEIRNISDETVSLADYCLSDKEDELTLWSFGSGSLAPGARTLVYCDGGSSVEDSYYHASFSLDCSAEDLFLCDAEGNILDAVFLHDVPVNGSMGRVDGQDGWFYFTKTTPRGENNTTAYPAVSEKPAASVESGIYNDVTDFTVELTGNGPIYYTLNGSVPTESSTLYTEPLVLSETTVVRAICIEEGNAPSRVATFSYILNENHVLPVLSLAVDDYGMFNYQYSNGYKLKTIAGSLSLYDESGEVFNSACGVEIKGKTSLSLPKKSLGITFDGIYGDGKLKCDVFGTGVDSYSSLNIRAGQDYVTAVIRNELVQALADEAESSVLTQASRYCILYINGEYYGLYCLKEDYSRSLYAEQTGVSKSSVSYLPGPAPSTSSIFRDLYQPCETQKMTDPDVYHAAIANVDLDSFIDWIIFEGWSCNTDTQGNVKFFASSETGNAYQFALYDLDWAFWYPYYNFTNMFSTDDNGNGAYYMARIIQSVAKNEEFRAAFLTRFAELITTTLSNEHVLEKIDEMAAEIEPEMERNQARWNMTTARWETKLAELKAFITDNDLAQLSINNVCKLLKVTDEERAQYFGTDEAVEEAAQAAESTAEVSPSPAP